MAREEARVFTSIWNDQDFLDLEPDPQRLYLFLLSQRELSYCGVLALWAPRWAKKARGLTVEAIEKALLVLENTTSPFVIVDYETGEVLIRSFIRRDQLWKQPNLLKKSIEAARMVESPRIRAAMAAELRRIPVEDSPSAQVKTLVAVFIRELEMTSQIPLPYPSGNPSPNPADDPNGGGSGHPADEASANPPGNPSAKGHAYARELGEGNGSSAGGSVTPGTLTPAPPTPPGDSGDARDRQRGTRLPANFAPSPDMVAWFRANCQHVDGQREHEAFCDYWVGIAGARGRKLDWPATWRNWMRKAEDHARPRTRMSPSVPFSAGDERRADVANLRERDRLQREGLRNVIPGNVVR